MDFELITLSSESNKRRWITVVYPLVREALAHAENSWDFQKHLTHFEDFSKMLQAYFSLLGAMSIIDEVVGWADAWLCSFKEQFFFC